jgi:rhodanese-related sulfurtransferase
MAIVFKRITLIIIAILLLAGFGGYLNSLRTDLPFFGVLPANENEKIVEFRKKLNKEIPILDFKAVRAIFLDNSKVFVDARNIEEFEKGHIKDAVSLPEKLLSKYLPEFLDKFNTETPLLIYCGGLDCSASVDLANVLFEKGYKNIEVYAGGWLEWQKLSPSNNQETQSK